jgi:hypothetical protein
MPLALDALACLDIDTRVRHLKRAAAHSGKVAIAVAATALALLVTDAAVMRDDAVPCVGVAAAPRPPVSPRRLCCALALTNVFALLHGTQMRAKGVQPVQGLHNLMESRACKMGAIRQRRSGDADRQPDCHQHAEHGGGVNEALMLDHVAAKSVIRRSDTIAAAFMLDHVAVHCERH